MTTPPDLERGVAPLSPPGKMLNITVTILQPTGIWILCLCVYVGVWVCVCAHILAQSYLILWDPMDYSPPGSSVHGILQARILEWGAFPPPGDLPDPEIEPVSPVFCIGSLFTTSHLCTCKSIEMFSSNVIRALGVSNTVISLQYSSFLVSVKHFAWLFIFILGSSPLNPQQFFFLCSPIRY